MNGHDQLHFDLQWISGRLLEAEPAPGKREPGLVAGKWR